MKKLFSKSGAMSTLVNVGIGGAANVAADSIFESFDIIAKQTDTVKNAIKVGVGILGGVISKEPMVHAAVDGIAVVGVSDLMKGLIKENRTDAPAGLPAGTIGRAPMRRGVRRSVRGTGALSTGFMGK